MIQFGTGGWRAIIGDEFTKANIRLLTQGLVMKMKAEHTDGQGIVIGYDRRFLSKEAMRWAAEVFAGNGITAKLINKSMPTPLVLYYVMKHKLPYGMMITASHNPAIYNGIKIFTAGGRDADERQTGEIEEYIAGIQDADILSIEYEAGIDSGVIEEIYPLNEYLDTILETMDVDKIRSSHLKVAIDPMFGVSETSLRTILLTARCEVDTIHENHDTLFGGKMPSPSAETLRALQTYVMEQKCDIGIATDGDADRIGVIDDKGRFLHPNEILVLLYYYLVKYKGWHGPAVRNIATTHLLDKVAAVFGESCYEVPVGFKHISAKMQETGAIIGGESSGGLTVEGHIHGKDGIYAAALLVEMIAVTGKKLSEIMELIRKECGEIYMEERDYTFTQQQKEEICRELMEDQRIPQMPYKIEKVSYLDGSKVYFENGGWVVARFSGTEPLLRIFCEMPKSREAKEVCDLYESFLGIAK
ncbi:MAG: phosphoglucomutase/phosphomannomutase family protein [Lachnospiraceae bacterium]